MFREIDKNGDGKIDFEEFTEHMTELIKKGKFDLRPNLLIPK